MTAWEDQTTSFGISLSYARTDEDYAAAIVDQLKQLAPQGLADTWFDRHIQAGTQWESEIEKRMTRADVIVMLISPAYLASDFINARELAMIEAAAQRGAGVWPVLIGECQWQTHPRISQMQLFDGGNLLRAPTTRTFSHQIAGLVAEIADFLRARLERTGPAPQTRPHSSSTGARGSVGIILAEGKSYPEEMNSSMKAAGQSAERIRTRIEEKLGNAGVQDAERWLRGHYQLANRLAHTYWLREEVGVQAWLVQLLFTDDVEHKPTSRSAWEGALARSSDELGIDHLRGDSLIEILLPALPRATAASAVSDDLASKGSQLQTQLYVNYREAALSQAVADALPVDCTAEAIDWRSPLQSAAFKEYRDGEFLAAVELSGVADELKEFWPARGPRWDALATVAL